MEFGKRRRVFDKFFFSLFKSYLGEGIVGENAVCSLHGAV